MTALFLEPTELVALTGRRFKSKQIDWLRSQGIPFWVCATGHPVVRRSAVEGRQDVAAPAPKAGWTPRVVGA
jgi:hypothetical protein